MHLNAAAASPHLPESEAKPNYRDEIDCARLEAELGKLCYWGEDILVGCGDGGKDHLESNSELAPSPIKTRWRYPVLVRQEADERLI